ncbi:MAG: dihydroorotate dehydrogenase [Thermoplasmata archaeon]
MGLYRFLRPLLYRLPADLTHEASMWAFRRNIWRLASRSGDADPAMKARVAQLELENPFGLAAGYDKNGDITKAMSDLGFGFVVVGSVRPRPHPGNPPPWFVRRPRENGLVNAMGLPSKGAPHVRDRLVQRSSRVPVLLSIAGDTVSDFAAVREGLQGHAAGWEINVSCPNTQTGRAFEEDPRAFTELLDALHSFSPRPFLKFSPYETEGERDRTLEMANLALRRGFPHFVLTNTLAVQEPGVGLARGGLSGRPLFPLALRAIRDFRAAFGDRVHIIGVGGVTTGEEAFQMLAAGAQALEVLTVLVLRGPGVVRRLLGELKGVLQAKGYASVEEAVGSAL